MDHSFSLHTRGRGSSIDPEIHLSHIHGESHHPLHGSPCDSTTSTSAPTPRSASPSIDAALDFYRQDIATQAVLRLAVALGVDLSQLVHTLDATGGETADIRQLIPESSPFNTNFQRKAKGPNTYTSSSTTAATTMTMNESAPTNETITSTSTAPTPALAPSTTQSTASGPSNSAPLASNHTLIHAPPVRVDSSCSASGSVPERALQDIVDAQLHGLMTAKTHVSWAEFYMSVALACAMRSKDKKTSVGAVIVGDDGSILSVGYNGNPIGIEDDPLVWSDKELKSKHVIHAESNAFIRVDRTRCKGATMYVTLFPCIECAKLIISYGIKTIVYWSDRGAEEKGTDEICTTCKTPKKCEPDPYRDSRNLLARSTVTCEPFMSKRAPYNRYDNQRVDFLVNWCSKQVKSMADLKKREIRTKDQVGLFGPSGERQTH